MQTKKRKRERCRARHLDGPCNHAESTHDETTGECKRCPCGFYDPHANAGMWEACTVGRRQTSVTRAPIFRRFARKPGVEFTGEVGQCEHGEPCLRYTFKTGGPYGWVHLSALATGLCPVCGVPVKLTGQTADGRLIGSCRDAFTAAQWAA